MSQDIVNLITQIAQRYGADPNAMLATARVESGLNPRAVGDGGTSFGLFQHHIGGAGGRTRESAQRYFDPVTSITERAKQFARLGIRSGQGAAALQRPADPAGYARKVDAALRGGGARLNAPVSGGAAPAMGAPAAPAGDDGVALAASIAFQDDPALSNLIGAALAPSVSDSGAASAPSSAPRSNPLPRGGKPLNRLLSLAKQFGAQVTSTTGGKHAPGSYHYSSRAIDIAPNPAFEQYAYANPGEFKEFFSPRGWHIKNGQIRRGAFPDHGDHDHAAI